MSSSPKLSQKSSRDNQENASGVVRKGKHFYIIDGEEVKGIKVRWAKYRPRIEAMERKAGFLFTKKGNRVPLNMFNRNSEKRDANVANLPDEADAEDPQSDSESLGSNKEEAAPIEETKKKAAPKKNAKKRQKTAK